MAPGNKALKDLLEEGKESGFLSLEELNRSIAAADMSAEDIDGVMGTIDDLGIQVVDQKKLKSVAAQEKEALSEDWSSTPDISNSIRMYLSEMGKVPLLSRDEEITLARNIREREKELRKLSQSSPTQMSTCTLRKAIDRNGV